MATINFWHNGHQVVIAAENEESLTVVSEAASVEIPGWTPSQLEELEAFSEGNIGWSTYIKETIYQLLNAAAEADKWFKGAIDSFTETLELPIAA